MNDNDIRKAKEHFTYGITHDIFSEPVTSYAKTALWAFEEVNRQKAEIERLRKAPKCLYEQETEYRSVSPCYNCEGAEEVRNATIKEFKKKLMTKLFFNFAPPFVFEAIDKTEIEMKSEMEGEMVGERE